MRPDLAGSDGYLRDCWYVAARSEDIERKLSPVRIMGERIVLFRGERGEPIALEDACPHRKLPLSRGTIEGSTVVCGYHGLTFDCTGACVIAPTQLDTPPRRAAVRSYPVEDRWGFLWIWMGDPERADRDAISRAVHDLVHEMGGSVSAEHGIGRLKTADLERYGDPVRLDALRAIKAALDPSGIMNPGAVLRGGA